MAHAPTLTVVPDDDAQPAPLVRLAYAPAEVAAVLGLSRSKVMALLSEGAIPSVLIGRARRIRHDDLVVWLESLREGQS